MNLYLSKKIKIASFILAVLIVILHSYNLVINYQAGPIYLSNDFFNFLLQKFISDGICRIAVPIFFMISGYLFFANIHVFDYHVYKRKLTRRARSVLLPFLIWSAASALGVWALQQIPGSEKFFFKYIFRDMDFMDWIDVVLLNPISYQLWFLKVLYFFVIVSPLFYLYVKYLKIPGMVFLGILWFFISLPFGLPVMEGALFFAGGAYLATHKGNLEIRPGKRKLILVLLIWFFLIGTKLYAEIFATSRTTDMLERFSIIPGVFFFWFSLDYIFHRINRVDAKSDLLSFSFFLFLFHEPTLITIKKLLIRGLGGVNPVNNFVTYLTAPALTIVLALIVGKIIKKYFPGLYRILTGSR